MRSRKQTPPELNGDHVDDASEATDVAGVDDALALAEEAEAEAAEAEAAAAAARARARALRLRREAEQAKAVEAEPAETEATEAAAAESEATEAEAAETEAAESAAAAAPAKDAEVETAPELDETSDAAEEAAEAAPKERRGRRRIRIPRIPRKAWKGVAATLTVLVIAALVAACGYMYLNHRQTQAELQRRAEFEAAARQGVVTLMSLDYTKAKEDVQRIIDNSTGQFKTDFQNTADDFVSVAIDSKAVTETNVTATAVESMNGDDAATVLVAASSRVTNSAGAKQEPRAWRLSVNLARDGGQLKLAKVEFVP